MEGTAQLLTAIAAVLWPLIVLVVLIRVAPTLQAVAESAKQRGFTVELAGQKVTMQELTTQQGDAIGDLLGQVAVLRKEFESAVMSVSSSRIVSPKPATDRTVLPTASSIERPRRILWVDDRPKNNSYLVSLLQQQGVAVDLVLSTADAIAAANNAKYDAVISDMGRQEGADYNVAAGVDVTRVLRAQHFEIPIIIFCAVPAAQRHGLDALAVGATGVTSSQTELLGLLGFNRRDVSA